MATSEKLYELKKHIKKLSSFRGSGTELISVYIPAGSAVHETSNKLREEMNQASNIKSKSTRTNVLGALEKIIGHLKLFRKPPENGLAVFAGNISDNPAKVDIELFSLEPSEPLRIGTYRCDNRFFLEPLERMMEQRDAYGILVLDGRDATLAVVKGTDIRVVKKLRSLAHAKVRKGGQCLAAGTLVVNDDGEILDIKNARESSKMVGLDFKTSKTLPVFASDFFITPAKHSIIVKTEHPLCEIRATPYHRFFVMSEYGLKEKFAKDLDKTDRVLVAKKINCNSSRIRIKFKPNKRIVLDKNERKRLKEARIRLGLSQKKAAHKVGLSQMIISCLERGKQTPSNENLRKIYKVYGLDLDEERLSKKTLRFPEYWNEDLARLFGIICGDGTLDGNRIIIYEGSKELVKNYCLLTKRTIGINPTIRIVDKTRQKGSFAKKEYFEVRIHSKEFVDAINCIAPEIITKDRDVPRDILKCGDKIVAAFLSGLYDAEGYIHGKRVDIAMINRRLMKKIQLLLLRFGILSSFAEKKVMGRKQWFVSISDRNAVSLFHDNIGFRRRDKKEKLGKACRRKAGQQYIDQVPIDGREVYKLAKEIGLKTSDFHAASSFFRNKKPLGKEAFARNILPVFKKHRRTGKGVFEYLNRIYNSDYIFASVKEKVIVEKKEEFYDVTIPVHSNFIANGFIVHNSARRYERLIEEQIEKYYKRVGEAMDNAFLKKVKAVVVGGPGPTKDFFLKMKPFNYQIKILGMVDTGYTDEYGVREVLAKAEKFLAEQEAIKEKKLVDRFIKEIISEGLAVYGVNEVKNAIISKQAERVLVSEDLPYVVGKYKCSSCGETFEKISREKAEERVECKSCKGNARLEEEVPLVDEIVDLSKENNIPVEVISSSTTEGAQFLSGFAGIGAFLRYK